MEKKVQELLKGRDEIEALANEIEIHTIVKWKYTWEILSDDNILKYQKLKMELHLMKMTLK